MEITLENVITLIALVTSAFSLYWNVVKFNQRTEQETTWKVGLNRDVTDLLSKVSRLLTFQESMTMFVAEFSKFKLENDYAHENLRDEFTNKYNELKHEQKLIRTEFETIKRKE